MMAQNENMQRKKILYTEGDLNMALRLIREGMSIRKAGKSCGVPYPTVRRHMIKNEIQRMYVEPTRCMLTNEEQETLKNAVQQQHHIFSTDAYEQNNTINIADSEEADDDTLLVDNSANLFKGNAFPSDASEPETTAYAWKHQRCNSNTPVAKKRKAKEEQDYMPINDDYPQALPSSKERTSPGLFNWATKNDFNARSGHHEAITTTVHTPMNVSSSETVLETLQVCKELLQQQNMKNNISNREEIFCNYLCTEIKKVTSDKIFQKLKLDILQLVNNALEENKVDSGKAYMQEIKLEPEILIDSN